MHSRNAAQRREIVRALRVAGASGCVGGTLALVLLWLATSAEDGALLVRATWYPAWSAAPFAFLNAIVALYAAPRAASGEPRWWRAPFHASLLALTFHSVYLALTLATPFVCSAAEKTTDTIDSPQTCKVPAESLVLSIFATMVAVLLLVSEILELYVITKLGGPADSQEVQFRRLMPSAAQVPSSTEQTASNTDESEDDVPLLITS